MNRQAHGLRTLLAGGAILALTGALAVPAAAADGEEVNLALTGTVTSSGQEVSGRFGPELTIDGDHGPAVNRSNPDVHNAAGASRWSANNADDAWIEIHLLQESEISEIAVDWGNTFGTPYSLSVSENGRTWQDVATDLTGVRDGIVTTDLAEPVTAGHVRLQIAGKSQQWPISIWEIEVLGTPIGEPPVPLEAALVPKPVEATAADGPGYTLGDDSCVSLADDSLAPVADRLREAIGTSTGLALPTGAECDVSIALDETLTVHAGQDEEAYTLDVDADGVRILAHSPRGALWGVRTLVQLLGPWAQAPVALDLEPTIEAVHIEDAPRYEWRGFMVDPARSFWPVEEVEQMIDRMSEYKLNVLHMHLSDDQGWRIAIDNEGRAEGDTIDYTHLTERSGSTAMMAGKSQWAPEAGRTGFYTKDDFQGLVAYAAERGVMVVPEIDGPGHATSMLYAVDELNTEGAFPHPAPGNTRVDAFDESTFALTTLDPRSEATYTFLEHVIGQITADTVAGMARAGGAALAPVSPYFHIGGDESQTTTGDDYTYYMNRASDLVTGADRLPIVWNEAISAASALPEGAVIQHWTGGVSEQTRAFVADKHGKILMSQVSHAYYPQIPTTDLGGPSWACGGTACGIDNFYNWDPTAMAGVDEAAVLGVEGPMWSEHLRTLHDLEFLVLPRMLAHAEVGWTPQQDRRFADFTDRVAASGISLLVQDSTFQLVPEVEGWRAGFAPAPIDGVDAAGEVLVGYLAAPGTADLADVDVAGTLTAAGAEEAGSSVDLRLEMERAFHYTDPNRTTGRIMNSLIAVYADLPALSEGAYELTLAGDTPVGPVEGAIGFEVGEAGGAQDLTETSVVTRCVVGKTVLVASVTNLADAALDVDVATPFGARSADGLAPGATKSFAFTTRAVSIDAGELTVGAVGGAVDGDPAGEERVAYAASSCS